MKNKIEEIFYYSHIKKALGIKKETDLMSFTYKANGIFFIFNNFNGRQNYYIINNKDSFISLLNNFLDLFNKYSSIKYKNIGIGLVEINGNEFINTISLFNSNNNFGYRNIKDLGLKINKNWALEDFYILNDRDIPKNEKKPLKDQKTYKKHNVFINDILDMIKNENFSIRNMKKIGIKHRISIKISNYLKSIGVFELDSDNKKKIYFYENIKYIDTEKIKKFFIK